MVAVSARSVDDLSSLAAECPSDTIRAYPLDITDPAAAAATVEAIERDIGELDVAVLNAGTHIPMTAETFSIENFEQLLRTNLMGTVQCLAPVMARFITRQHGHIAVVASVAGYRGLPSAAGYGATKAALINMCEALKPDLDRHGVRLMLINPGFVETPLTAKNEFPMPFLITAEDAADRIFRGLQRPSFEIAFPRRFIFLTKLLRLLPYQIFFFVTRRMLSR